MFIKYTRGGYDRHGQQFASGLFLMLVQPKESEKYPTYEVGCAACGRDREAHDKSLAIAQTAPQCPEHGIMARLKARLKAKEEPVDADFVEIVPDPQGCACCSERAKILEQAGCCYFQCKHYSYPIRALVRHTSLHQMGHWMMGYARVGKHRLTLSGSYGSDGLTMNVPDDVYDRAVPVPPELIEAWNKGGGWNSSGSEAPAMRQWALDNLKSLRG